MPSARWSCSGTVLAKRRWRMSSTIRLFFAAAVAAPTPSRSITVKAGITRDYIAAGETSFSVDYYDGNDFVVAGSSTSSVGVAVVQRLDAYNTELYATHRSYDFDDASASYQDLDVTFVGARWEF